MPTYEEKKARRQAELEAWLAGLMMPPTPGSVPSPPGIQAPPQMAPQIPMQPGAPLPPGLLEALTPQRPQIDLGPRPPYEPAQTPPGAVASVGGVPISIGEFNPGAAFKGDFRPPSLEMLLGGLPAMPDLGAPPQPGAVPQPGQPVAPQAAPQIPMGPGADASGLLNLLNTPVGSPEMTQSMLGGAYAGQGMSVPQGEGDALAALGEVGAGLGEGLFPGGMSPEAMKDRFMAQGRSVAEAEKLVRDLILGETGIRSAIEATGFNSLPIVGGFADWRGPFEMMFGSAEGDEQAAGEAAAAEAPNPVRDALMGLLGERATSPLGAAAGGLGAVTGSGGGDRTISMGAAPGVPGAVQEPMPTAPNLDRLRALFEKTAPQGTSEEEIRQTVNNSILAGIAQGTLSVPSGAGIGDVLLGLGMGAVGGLGSGRQAGVEMERANREANEEFAQRRLQLETELENVRLQHDQQVREAETNNLLRKREAAIEQMRQSAPRVLGVTADRLLVERSDGKGGREVQAIDIQSETDKILARARMIKALGGTESDTIDLLSTELDPRGAGEFAPLILGAHELAQSGMLANALGKEGMQTVTAKAEAALEEANLTGDPDLMAADQRRAILNATVGYLIQHPEVLLKAASASPSLARVAVQMQDGAQ